MQEDERPQLWPKAKVSQGQRMHSAWVRIKRCDQVMEFGVVCGGNRKQACVCT